MSLPVDGHLIMMLTATRKVQPQGPPRLGDRKTEFAIRSTIGAITKGRGLVTNAAERHGATIATMDNLMRTVVTDKTPWFSVIP